MSKQETPKPTKSTWSMVRENAEALLVAIILALIIRHFSLEAFEIPTGSMAPGLYGVHLVTTCPNCGTESAVGVPTDPQTGRVRLSFFRPGRVYEGECTDCGTLRMELLLEVKDAQIIGTLSKSLKNRDPELITISSFHAPFLKAFKAVRPEFVTSLLLGTVFDLDEMILVSHRYQCDAVHPCWESRAPFPHRLLSREVITRLHEAGLKVFVWHEEREDELRCLLDLGVEGICTNDPKRLKNLRDRA